MASLSVRAANVLRLPFEFAACWAGELCAFCAAALEVPETPKARAIKVHSTEPLALCLALRPFLPAFQQSIAEQAKSGRESLWASYDTQAKDAVQLTKQVAQPARRWLRRCLQRVMTADWQTTLQLLTEGWRRFATFLSALRPRNRKALLSALEDVHRECDDVKEIFKAGKLEEAEKRYQLLLCKVQDLSKAHLQNVTKEEVRILTNLALCQKKQGCFAPAAASADAALKLEPANVKALFLHGSCREGAEAIEDFARAFALEPLQEAKLAWLQARRALRKDVDDTWTKGEVLAVLADVTRVQQSVQEAVSTLGQAHLKEREKEKLSFLEAHELIRQLGLPKDPLKDYGLTADSFHQLLGTFQEDFDVIQAAQRMMHPAGRGDRSRARRMSVQQIVQSHEAMVQVIQQMLKELRQMTPLELNRLDLQFLEATAELLSYLEVSNLDLHPEDVEEAISMNEFQLQNSPDFAKCSEDLANLMQELMDLTSSLP